MPFAHFTVHGQFAFTLQPLLPVAFVEVADFECGPLLSFEPALVLLYQVQLVHAPELAFVARQQYFLGLVPVYTVFFLDFI